MIDWLLKEPHRLVEIFEKNVCCVVTKAEAKVIDKYYQRTHPDRERPWLRYEGLDIRVLFNPDWPSKTLEELRRHGLIDESSYKPNAGLVTQ
jgi:hypothetical protein